MAFEPLKFTKSWENPQDFPAYEPDETQVRADLQLLHEETRLGVNRLIEALNSSGAAAMLPFRPEEGLTAETVQAAILETYRAIQNAAAGQLVDGSIGKEKLTAVLLERIYGGRLWLSLDTPDASHNPDRDFPVGQLWLRPAFTVTNLAQESWEVSGCTAEETDNGWLVTADGSQETVTLVQSLDGVGNPGQRCVVSLTALEPDDHLSGLTLYLNGVDYELLSGGGVVETALDQTGSLELLVRGEWPYKEAGAQFRLEKLAVVNADAVEAGLPGYRPLTDWIGLIASLLPFGACRLPQALYLQTEAGRWEQISFEVLPVEHGGTGLQEIGNGQLLYGTGHGFARLEPPVEDGCELQFSNGKPTWKKQEDSYLQWGMLRMKHGTYTGDGANNRTLELPLTPKLLFLRDPSQTYDYQKTVLADGDEDLGWYSYLKNNETYRYWSIVSLSGSTLQFQSGALGQAAKHFNEAGQRYKWTAIY